MSNTVNSPNMLLPVPVVGVDPGPNWASDLNSCLALIDGHDHSPGKGVAITPAGINISSDLPVNDNNLTLVRSTRYFVNASPLVLAADLGCVYVSGVDLYFNDVNGNHIQITQGGGVAGSPGSIANLTSPASASYVAANKTFVWQSDVNTPANMDGASYIFRNLSASSKGLTLSPPLAMGADYSLVLPPVAGANGNFLTMDTSGNISSSVAVDNATLQVAANVLKVKAAGITSTQLAANSVGTSQIIDANVTNAKLAAANKSTSSNNPSGGITSTTLVDVGNLTVTLTTVGRPVFLAIQNGLTAIPGSSSIRLSATTTAQTLGMYLAFLRDGTVITVIQTAITFNATSASWVYAVPYGAFHFIDTGASAASHTYKVQVAVTTGVTCTIDGIFNLLGYEM